MVLIGHVESYFSTFPRYLSNEHFDEIECSLELALKTQITLGEGAIYKGHKN